MDSSHDGAAGDSSKCNEMSVDEKRQLVYELSKQTHLASEVLQAWSRQEILQILCAEMGKERKYTGLTKVKIIETLLKIVSEKNSGENEGKKRDSDSLPIQKNTKRQRKVDNPSRYVVPVPATNNVTSNNASGSCSSVNTKGESTIYCNNLACRAVLRQEDSFCRRCSCCICHKYDDNKDPSLWLTCSSDPPFEGESCGFSCHLECAFKTEKSGLAKDKRSEGCCFYCVSCGKTNSLLECWKKQLTIAKETRRVDVLCYRLFLVQKLLKGSTTYLNLCEVVDEAVKCLEADVGPLTGLSMKMGRGIVNRLQSGPDVQKLCSTALESLETLKTTNPEVVAVPSPRSSKVQQDCSHVLSNEISADTATTGSTKIRFEDVNATSLTVVLASNDIPSPPNIVHYSIWHRKVPEKDYPEKSTCTLFTPNTRFVVSGLAPASEYCFRVVSYSGTREMGVDEINVLTRSAEEGANCSSAVERSESPLTNCSTLSSNPSSVEAESNNDYIAPKRPLKNDLNNSPSVDESAAKREKRTTESEIVQIENNVEEIVLLEEEEEQEAVLDKNRSRSETPVLTTTTNLVSNRNNSDASLPITPFRSDEIKNRQARKDNCNNGDHSANGGSESGLEHCVKIIRQLECSGHIDKTFRQKFLTWYSLRATSQEIRVVKIYIDTFIDDPMALAEQLIDTFDDRVSIKRSAVGGGSGGASAVVPSGFCMKLWH
ncbi:PREDICTED: VIN3-like protein 2 isoform X1 [Camelina sativa]|uniref:VIN3-like protein 2 isoform X1 n=1 Tax=Camelina sativa TaxID=90675 RepID=A0ABM0UXF3_CAMSA|nr:PREDICTED: VIN3-like protein 2 isoform X1 [Camelina sativa]